MLALFSLNLKIFLSVSFSPLFFPFKKNKLDSLVIWNENLDDKAGHYVEVMAAIAVRKKVVSIGHFSPSICLQSLGFLATPKSLQNRSMFVREGQMLSTFASVPIQNHN